MLRQSLGSDTGPETNKPPQVTACANVIVPSASKSWNDTSVPSVAFESRVVSRLFVADIGRAPLGTSTVPLLEICKFVMETCPVNEGLSTLAL